MRALYVHAIGAFTAVGHTVGATMGSLWTGYTRVRELPITGPGGEPVAALPTAINEDISSGPLRMLAMSGFALRECARDAPLQPIPLVLCGPDPREVAVDFRFFCRRLMDVTGVPIDLEKSIFVPGDHAAIALALLHADELLASGRADACYVAGADTLLELGRLRRLVAERRIRGGDKPEGVVPGEAAVFLRVARRPRTGTSACLRGVGTGEEPVVRTTGRVSAAGLVRAMRGALDDAAARVGDVALLAVDLASERLPVHEMAVAKARLRGRAGGRAWNVWKPQMEVGDIGAALGPLVLAYLSFLIGKGCLVDQNKEHGGALYVGSSELGLRGAVFVSEVTRG